jgi:hypothetical protein
MDYYLFDDYGWFAGVTQELTARATEQPPPAEYSPPVDGELHPNWSGLAWTMVTYSTPEPVYQIPAEPEVEDPRIWWVDVGPYKDRLGMDAAAIYASDHPACRGVIGLVDGRKYINLKDTRIRAMMMLLVQTQQPAASPYFPGSGPMTMEKLEVVLDTPTTEYERHIKGLTGIVTEKEATEILRMA